MKIRWKILLILLAISLAPMMLMRWGGSRNIRNLGIELSERSGRVLFQQSAAALKRLVEDHARLLKRDGELVQTVLTVQAAEFEKRLIDPLHAVSRPYKMITGADASNETAVYCRHPEGSGSCMPLPVSRSDISFRSFSEQTGEEIKLWKTRFSSMIDIYDGLTHETDRRDLYLWQMIVLDSGIQSLYPSVKNLEIPDYRLSKWYQRSIGQEKIIWHLLEVDPLTRKLVMIVSTPIYDATECAVGVAAVMLPVGILLHENKHIRMISRHVTSLLVVPDQKPVTGETGIRIIADEDTEWKRRRWRYLSSNNWLLSDTPESLSPVISDLRKRRSGVREISYKGKAAVAAYSVVTSAGPFLMLIVPKADLVAEAAAMKQYVLKRFTEEIKTTGIFLIAIMAAVLLVALMVSRYVTRNINKLAEAAQRLATGDFSSRVIVSTRDEIGELGHAFNRMVPDLEERIRMKQGLALARSVQQGLLPQTPPEISGFDIAAQSIYCDETGGDFYDFIPVRREESPGVGLIVGDVSGHGISAALLMATARAFLKSRLSRQAPLSNIFQDVNRLVCSDTDETGQFLTLFYLELFSGADDLRWIRAGHDPALLYDPEKDIFTEMMGEGMALGVNEAASYSSNILDTPPPGAIILIGTDGIWEARNGNGEMFSKENLKKIIRNSFHKTAQDIASAVTESVKKFVGNAPFEDDVTLAVIKVEEKK